MKKSLYGIGDLVVFNEKGIFGDKHDCLLHIHDVAQDVSVVGGLQYFYRGYLLKIGEYESIGLPQIPVFRTTILGVRENQIKALDNLGIRLNPCR